MNKWSIYNLVITCMLLGACGGKQSTEKTVVLEEEQHGTEFPITVPFEMGIENEREVSLSQIAEKVEYIPLETKADCLLSNYRGYIQYIAGNYIIPCSRGVYMFDGKGKFVRRIGRQGQGPGEYSLVLSLDVDRENELIYLLDNGKVNVYSLTGDYLKSIPLPEVRYAAILNDSILASFIYNSSGQMKDRILLFNQAGDKVKVFPRHDLFTIEKGVTYMMMGSNDRYLFHYDNHLCFKDYYCDTLYTVTENELQPRYVIQLGKYAMPLEARWENQRGDQNKFTKIASSYLRVNVMETDSFLFMPYSHWAGEKSRLEEILIYEKNTQACFKVAGNIIKNDLEGKLPFIPYTSIGDNLLLSIWTPSDILEQADKDSSILEHPQLKGLKEDDNPVLIVVHFK